MVCRRQGGKSGDQISQGFPTLYASSLAYLGLEVGMQQHVAIQVDGKHIAVSSKLRVQIREGGSSGSGGLGRDALDSIPLLHPVYHPAKGCCLINKLQSH